MERSGQRDSYPRISPLRIRTVVVARTQVVKFGHDETLRTYYTSDLLNGIKSCTRLWRARSERSQVVIVSEHPQEGASDPLQDITGILAQLE